MLSVFREKPWPSYLVGAAIGLLLVVSILFCNKPLGVSSSLAQVAAFIITFGSKATPLFNWGSCLLMGIFLGGICAAYLSSFKPEQLAPVWTRNFGNSLPKRYAVAYGGGALILIGARIAGGCTTGHAISGAAQLSVAGWLFIVCIFISGILSAHLIYRK